MPLLDELTSLDLSGITSARASIQVSVKAPGIDAIVKGGAARTALGSLGSELGALEKLDASALFRPLGAALTELGGAIHVGDLPLGPYADAVREGAGIVAGLLEGVDGDPSRFGERFGTSIGAALEGALAGAGALGKGVLGGGAVELGRLVESVESGLPTDPARFADVMLDVLLPLPGPVLRDVRAAVSSLLDGSLAIALPTNRTEGLADALDAVAQAAARKSSAELTVALDKLAQVRLQTVATLGDDLGRMTSLVHDLRVAERLAPLGAAERALRKVEMGLLEFLEDIRRLFAQARARVETFDPVPLLSLIPTALERLEQHAQREIADAVDAQVARLKEWLRGLFRKLPLAEAEARIHAFFHGLATSIDRADLGRFAREAKALLEKLTALVSPAALTADVRAALQAANAAIEGAMSGVTAALATIKSEIDAVAAKAQGVLAKVLPAVKQFRAAIDGVRALVEQLGIEAAGQAIIGKLRELRSTAEKLLTVVPLPEPLRPQIEQLAETLRNLDLDVAFTPIREAAAQIKLPDEVTAKIESTLAEAAKVVENLIPKALVAAIEADVNAALATLAGFDPTKLLPDLKGVLASAAEAVAKLAPPASIAAELSAPFQRIVEALDAVHPAVLLAPAIQAYDDLLGRVPVPSPEAAVRRAGDLFSAAGDSATRALAAPMAAASPQGSTTVADARSKPTPTAAMIPPSDLRPGDVIRLFGYLPRKLREALQAMEAGPVGDVLAALDRLTAGLARDLRRLRAALWAVEARLEGGLDLLLAPLAEKQVHAQLSIRAGFDASSGVDVRAAMVAVSGAGPMALRDALAGPYAQAIGAARHAASGTVHAVGEAIEAAAVAIERCSLTRLAASTDGLLAALDPEPIAAEMDALVAVVFARAPALMDAVGDTLEASYQRLRDLVARLNPGAQAHKLLAVLDVLAEELDRLSPRRLAAELGEVHAAVRRAVLAYDPAPLLAEVSATVSGLSTSLRTLDPASLMGDLSFFQSTLDKVRAASPAEALKGAGASLDAVGAELVAVDVKGLSAALGELGPRIVGELEDTAKALRDEIVALVEAIRYASGGVQASASVEVK